MKKCFYVVFLSWLFTFILYSQDNDSSQTEFLKHAPPRVQDYYRVFDSLAHPTWKKWVYETWADDELKKYASLIYDADDYDPIAKNKYDLNRGKVTNDAKIGYVTKSRHVLDEIEKRFSKKYARLIEMSYWLTIVVEDIETLPYLIIKDVPSTKWTEKRIHGKATEVLKGEKIKVGDSVTCYYMKEWGYRGLAKGNSYVVALYTIVYATSGNTIFALGGPDCVQESVFPIEGDYVTDSDNVFGLGKKVNLSTFTNTLTSTINEIKSWKDGGR